MFVCACAWLLVCLFVCAFVLCVRARLFVCACLSVGSLVVWLRDCGFARLVVCLFARAFVCGLSACLFVYALVCWCVCVFACLRVRLFA